MEINDDLLLELLVQSWNLRHGEGLGVEECGFGMEGSSGQRMIPGRLDVVKTPRWTLRVVNFLGKHLVT